MNLHHDFFAGPAAAPALVLLHGWGLHGGVWQDWVPQLRGHFNVTVVDLPGFGGSAGVPWPESPARLDELLLAVAPPRAVWLGWSLGGLLALGVAARCPGRVQALTMLAATPCFVQRIHWATAMPASLFSEFRKGVDGDAGRTLQRFLALQCHGSPSSRADIRFLRQVLAEVPLPSAGVLARALDVLAEADARGSLAALAVPLQFILGGNDALVPRALATALPAHAQTVVINDAAHLPFLSHAAPCRDALLAFCRRCGVVP